MIRYRLTGIASIALLLLVGCAAQSREDKIASLRSYYSAEFNGFLVSQTPVEPDGEPTSDVEDGEEGDPDGGEEMMEPAAEGDAAMETEPVELRTVLLLDILVQHSAPERLPGVTVDVSMVDAALNEKARWRIWVETADLAKATHKQISHEVEVDSYEEGDGFYAEVRHPIAPEERADYREFSMGAS